MASNVPVPALFGRWLYVIGVLIVSGFLVGLYGIFLAPSDKSGAFTTVIAICLGAGLLVLFADRIAKFTIGPVGATLKDIEEKVDKLTKLQELQLKMYYQINRDLLGKRFEAYGQLWSNTQMSAIYTAQAFGPKEVAQFAKDLTKWYFTATGGLLLTKRARDFYFSLQDLLRELGRSSDWQCNNRPDDPKSKFAELLEALTTPDLLNELNKLREDDPGLEAPTGSTELDKQVKLIQKEPEKLNSVVWKAVCKWVTHKLKERVADPAAGEDIYAAIQQVSSVLRTNLTHELRSRFDVDWPAELEQALAKAPAPGTKK